MIVFVWLSGCQQLVTFSHKPENKKSQKRFHYNVSDGAIFNCHFCNLYVLGCDLLQSHYENLHHRQNVSCQKLIYDALI